MRLLLSALGVALSTTWAATVRAGDPYLTWWTVSTPHFRVHYHGGLEEIAQRTATIAEMAHQALVPTLGWEPSEVTQILLTDDSDAANGSASATPYNAIRLFVAAPQDMAVLNDYDDWLVELVTHEHTHVLHVDNVTGAPAVVNAVFGKIMTPNQEQPRWILEGLAVAEESRHTTAGRVRSTQFDMYLRADVLEDRVAELDEISHGPRRWPGGNLWYLYGGRFVEWILDTYGPDTFAAVAQHYGRSLIDYGINRAIRRATGRTYPELYRAWKRHLAEHYRDQVLAIEERGLRQGRRLTRHGRVVSFPRWVPARCWQGSEPELVYFRDDGHEPAGFYVGTLGPGGITDSEIITRASGSVASFGADCSIVFDSVATSRRRHYLSDLFRLPAGERAPGGNERNRQRMTWGRRAREPAVSPDGRRIAYVTQRAGTATLRVSDLTAHGTLENERRLVPSARFEQAFTPRFSPDGTRLAYSVWSQGGYRDVRIVDVATGAFFAVTHDRAIDQQPAWSPDGRTLFFTSDRTGVANVYAFDLDSKALSQVTNVVTGAYMPEISEDGGTLVYVGYRSNGFDLFSMPLDRSRWLKPLPAPTRPEGEPSVLPHRWPISPYRPLPTLRPHSYGLEVGTGTFGTAVTLSTDGADIVGHHAFAAEVTYETEGPEWQGSLDYAYRRLPFDLRATVFRGASPRSDAEIDDEPVTVTEHLVGFTSGIAYGMPGEYDYQSVGLSYTVGDYSHDLDQRRPLDPEAAVPVEPHSGVIAAAHVGYVYSSASGSLYGISAERGFTFGLGIDYADPALGSETTLTSFSTTLTGYLRTPWHRHHVLALAASGGSAGGTYPRRGLFSTGGFADEPPLDSYTSGIRQGAFVLRGYEPGQFSGTDYALFNAEYRFPIALVDRGVSTLPVFLQTLSGVLFADYGGAFFGIDPDRPSEVLHLGVGAELWIDLVLAYTAGSTLRLGVARGLDHEAPDGLMTYFVAASAF